MQKERSSARFPLRMLTSVFLSNLIPRIDESEDECPHAGDIQTQHMVKAKVVTTMEVE